VESRSLSRAAVRALDARAIDEYGIPSLLLMENAGRACAEVALEMLRGAPGPVLCLCGAGNNGGDGLVIARTLANRGVAAEVLVLASPERLARASEDVRVQLALWRGLGGRVEHVVGPEVVGGLAARLERSPLVVDALFGTGLDRPLEAPLPELFELVRRAGPPVLAVDIPSGLDADTGAVLGAVLRAERTVTFVAAKPGFARGAGPEACGRVDVAEIGIPRAWVEEALAAAGSGAAAP